MISVDGPERNQSDIVPPMRLRDRITRGVFWNFLSTAFTQGVTFGVNILVARFLGKQLFGQFSLLQTTVVAAALLTSMAMGGTVNKYVAQFSSTDPAKTSRILGFCFLMSILLGGLGTVVLASVSGWFSTEIFEAPELSWKLAFVAIGIVFGSVTSFQNGVFAGLLQFRALAMTNILCGGLYLAGCGPAAALGGLQGTLGIMIGYYGLQLLAMQAVLRKILRRKGLSVNIREGLGEWKFVLSFSIPFALANLSLWPTRWVTQTILFRQENGDALLGVFTAANQLRMLAVLIPFVITNYSWSLLNQQYGLNDISRYKKIYKFNVFANIGSFVILGFLILLLTSPLLQLFGKEFQTGKEILWILMFSGIPEILSLSMSLTIQARGRIWLHLACLVFPRDVTRIVSAYLLCPRYGAEGLAISYVLGWTIGLAGVVAALWWVGLYPRMRTLDEA